MQNQTSSHLPALVLAGVMLLLTIIAAAVSMLPYDLLSGQVDRLSEGRADFFTPEFLHEIQLQTRIAATFFALAATLLLLFRRRVSTSLRLTGRLVIDELKAGASSVRVSWSESSRLEKTTLLLLMLIAVVLRSAFLHQPMRYDEAVSWVVFSSKPFYVTLSYYPFPNNHIVHNLLVSGVTTVTGSSAPWSIRIVEFFHGLILIPLIWLVLRPWRGKVTALIATGWAAASMLVLHATNARGYSMLSVSVLLMIPLARKLIQGGGSGAAVLLAILGALAFWNIPLAILPFGAIMAWLTMNMIIGATPSRSRLFRGILLSGLGASLLALLLYVPVFIVTDPKALFGNEYVETKNLHHLAQHFLPGLKLTLETWTRDMPHWLMAVAGVGLIAALAGWWVDNRRSLSPLIPALVWSLLVTVGFREVTPPRGWIFLHLFVIFASAGGLGWLVSRQWSAKERSSEWIALGLALLFAVGQGVPMLRDRTPEHAPDTGTFPDAERVVERLLPILEEGDVLLAGGKSTSFPLAYYLQQATGSTRVLQTNPRKGKRTFILEDTVKAPLADVLEDIGLPIVPPDSLEHLMSVGSARVYLIPEGVLPIVEEAYDIRGRRIDD